MRIVKRAAALACMSVLGLAACGTAPTIDTGSGSVVTSTTPPSSYAQSSSTAVTAGSTPRSDPTGKAELKIITTPYGKAIGRGDGKVLYAWDLEVGGVLKCLDAKCLDKWPPLLAGSFTIGDGLDKASFSLITRPDGTKQVAIGGRALYAMSADSPGEANCQGVTGWWILKPDGSKNTATEAAK